MLILQWICKNCSPIVHFFRFIGIEVLKKLYSLNLSHNSISRIENLVRSTSLVELNLSMNELEDISYMPSMMNLKILNLNNNKVRFTILHNATSISINSFIVCVWLKIRDILYCFDYYVLLSVCAWSIHPSLLN